ncbi:uncharacterized protein LOC119327602 isoform X2 [Triticum dicoccoides]|uniref:uncharacterized protein LOC119327602 isoform X2 n=1 Tax=Triticum dicoccoides TaxID=85692 RepID=UPI00189173E0|nr:uncharacterized protein LOC119327602 isoform X2 [Triticum dicoccoides]
MGSPAWRGLWRGLSRCGRSPYTAPPPPSLYLARAAEVPDASGRRHLAVQRHAISHMLGTMDLAPSINTEEWWKRRSRYHGASWVQAHAPSRFFSATPKDLLKGSKADPSDLAVPSPGDDAHGPGDMAMHNRFASAQPIALVEQGEANVRDNDYPLIKPEDDGLTEAIKCYMLKTGADQIVPDTWAAEYGAREDVEIVYPLSSPISIVANWSGDGIISYVKMKIKQLEVKWWQIRYLSKAAQAAGAIDSNFERGLICVEEHAYLYLPLIRRREMLPTLSSSYHIFPQMRRFFSRRKRKFQEEIILKAKNSGVLCLDGTSAEVKSSLRKVIAQLRQFCYDHGERVDVSSIYGPGSEVYTPPGVGTFHLEVLHCERSISFPILANKLYFRAFRNGHGMFVFKNEEDFKCDEDYIVLDFTGSYTSAGLARHSVGDTWIGTQALRHAFHVISKCNGRSTDLLKQAIQIFIIHIAEAARIQCVLDAVCESITGERTHLDEPNSQPTCAPSSEPEAEAESAPSSEAEAAPSSETEAAVSPAASPPSSATEAAPVASSPAPPPSYWIATYGHYSNEAKEAINAQLTKNVKYTIISKDDYQITSLDDILKQIRILSRGVHNKGVFAHKADDSLLALPKECPPDPSGKEVEYPYALLEEWNTGKIL